MWRTRVSREITRCTKLRGVQRSPELSLRSTDFRAPENLIFPALLTNSLYFQEKPLLEINFEKIQIFDKEI